MSIEVVTKEEHDALLKRLAAAERRLELLEQTGGASTPRDFLTPKEVAKRFAVREALVYDACEKGKVEAEKRPISQGRVAYRIRPGDAQAWYDAFVRKGSNQGGAP